MNKPFHIDYSQISSLYANEQIEGTLYLAFRDIPDLLERYLKQREFSPINALDFGCGTGVSTRFLKKLKPFFPLGLEVEGVDISPEMIGEAKREDPAGIYHLLQNDRIPVKDSSYDLIFSTFVLFEFATKSDMRQALEEVKRVMRQKALFIAVTGSIDTYNRHHQWVSLQVDFPQNNNLTSGSLGRVDFVMPEGTLTFQNYYWTESDYGEVFQATGLRLLDTLHPRGHEDEALPWKWKSEKHASPYYIFVLTKE
ncbi:class I SAM-dependent methyltransferase [Candidatus Protochlamydia phocaeensis]|uniref:class I SAM-dependent methyltransferase n=1 Tax=Candidatus Protochlamydia phocaeensis TaxID=1414722 RepID=UPI0008388E46|nr:class I SAM-dependent methyltransferase [Candidatus Protochlamydia phocaeensis]